MSRSLRCVMALAAAIWGGGFAAAAARAANFADGALTAIIGATVVHPEREVPQPWPPTVPSSSRVTASRPSGRRGFPRAFG
jgi:hypothetical protein